MKRPAITAMTGAAAVVLLAAACSSSPTKTTGTETFQGTATGATVIASSTTYPLKFTGPVTATATWTTPSSNADKVTTTFKTTAGNLVVNADVNANNPATTVDASTCLAKFTISGTYAVDGAQSTDKFKGATGHGTIKDVVQAYLPKLVSNGKCNEANNAQPLAAGAQSTFYASGPLTVSS
jgi:hypothetical protein